VKTLAHFVTLLVLACALDAGAQGVAIDLSPPTQDVKRGELPRIIVTVRAGDRARIADIVGRPDFRDRLIQPRVSGTGDADDLAIAMKDLGPVGPGDYLTLERGNSLSFESDGSPLVLRSLGPGTYKFLVRYKPDWSSAAIQSNAVMFRVVP
jgi:hypothetical protein